MNLHSQARMATRIALVCIGAGGAFRGVAYLPPWVQDGPLPAGIGLISSHGVPLVIWALSWILGGLISIVCACTLPDPKPVGTAVVVGMTYVWGLAYGLAWVLGLPHAAKDWLGAATYIFFATVLVCGAVLSRVALLATPGGGDRRVAA